MRTILIASLFLTGGSASALERLPLKEGEYSFHPCNSAQALEKNGSLGIYTTSNGATFITPASEGIDAYCTIASLSKRGNTFAGRAKCANGGMKVKFDVGTYTFKYAIKNATSFVSNDALYNWCAPHR